MPNSDDQTPKRPELKRPDFSSLAPQIDELLELRRHVGFVDALRAAHEGGDPEEIYAAAWWASKALVDLYVFMHKHEIENELASESTVPIHQVNPVLLKKETDAILDGARGRVLSSIFTVDGGFDFVVAQAGQRPSDRVGARNWDIVAATIVCLESWTVNTQGLPIGVRDDRVFADDNPLSMVIDDAGAAFPKFEHVLPALRL